MDRTRQAGVVVVALGTVGYVLGVLAPYPGRSAAIVGVMVGVTLAVVGGGNG
jgi:hypothetical protein